MIKSIKYWFQEYVLLPITNKEDTDSLQSFAITMAIAFPVIFMLLLPFIFDNHIPTWPIIISMLLTGLYLLKPKWLYYPYLLWMLFASILGYINTRIILAIAYYLLIVPIGLVMKVRKGLQYKAFDDNESAWVKREKPPQKQNLKEPF